MILNCITTAHHFGVSRWSGGFRRGTSAEALTPTLRGYETTG